MKLKKTSTIQQFLDSILSDRQVSEDIKGKALDASKQNSIDWDTLKQLHAARSTSISLHQLCRGSGLDRQSFIPKQKQSTKSPELQAHLDKLQRKLDQDRYDAMTKDVTVNERKAIEASQGGFVTYKQQISFGLHVIVMMGAFYLFGYIAGTALTTNKVYRYGLGLALMIGAMLLETILFVIRTTVPPRLHSHVEKRKEEQMRRRKKMAGDVDGDDKKIK